MPSLSSPTFWRDIKPFIGTLQQDEALYFVVLNDTTKMQVIQRETTETETGSLKTAGFKVVVNANLFDTSNFTRIKAMTGVADAASQTMPIGKLINRGAVIGGSSQPLRFYFAQRGNNKGSELGGTFVAGMGDPPLMGTLAAIGGVGPLIINSSSYNSTNIYRPGAPGSPPATGNPPPNDASFLQLRSNLTFASVEQRNPLTGKTILAASSSEHKLIVIVQPNGAGAGTSYSKIRDSLMKIGVDNATFMDGSDSVFLRFGNQFVVRPSNYKDNMNTVAVGFT